MKHHIFFRRGSSFSLLIIILVVGFGYGWGRSEAHGGVFEYKPLSFEVRPGDRILIKGFDGHVKMVVGPPGRLVVKVKQETFDNVPPIIRQTMDDWNFSAQRVDHTLELAIQSSHTKEVWRQMLMNGRSGHVLPKFYLEVTAPALPLEIAWRKGRVDLENWTKDAKITLQEGVLQVLGGSGELRAYGQETSMTVRKRMGRQQVETYANKLVLDSCKGAIDSENFAGDTLVTGLEGSLDHHTFKGNTMISQGKGRVEFETVRGPIKIQDFAGDLKGVSEEGAIAGRLLHPNEVRINTQLASVQLELPGSGAHLSLSSVSGSLFGPPGLQSEQLARMRVLKGRLRGNDSGGAIMIHTESGAVRVR